MSQSLTTKAQKSVQIVAGLALLVTLFPIHGVSNTKPAGVRTAIEMISKKISVRADDMAFTAAA